MSDLDAGEDMFDDFLNSRLEDDENIDQSVGDAINDDEFEKLLNESETEIVQNEPEKKSIGVDSSSIDNKASTTSNESINVKKEEQQKEDDEEVIEFSWSDEDYSKDETDQVNQNNLISEIKIQQEQPIVVEKTEVKESKSTSTSNNNNNSIESSVKSEDIIETRISVMISDVLNRFGKVIDIDSRSDAIENRIKSLKEEDTESEYSFGKLKGSIQRKLVVLECAVENLSVLVEKNVQRKLKLRESKKILKDQLRTSIERYSEKCTQLDEQKEKYSKMENLWEKDRKNLLEIIDKLKQQVETKDPENEFIKSMKIPDAPKETDSDDNTLSNLTKSLLSLPETWKSSNPTDSNPQSNTSSSTSSNSTTDPNKVDPLAKASSWFQKFF